MVQGVEKCDKVWISFVKWQGVARCSKVWQRLARCVKDWQGVSKCVKIKAENRIKN